MVQPQPASPTEFKRVATGSENPLSPNSFRCPFVPWCDISECSSACAPPQFRRQAPRTLRRVAATSLAFVCGLASLSCTAPESPRGSRCGVGPPPRTALSARRCAGRQSCSDHRGLSSSYGPVTTCFEGVSIGVWACSCFRATSNRLERPDGEQLLAPGFAGRGTASCDWCLASECRLVGQPCTFGSITSLQWPSSQPA